MSMNTLRLVCVGLALGFANFAAPAGAATFSTVELRVDGSAEPPGDELLFDVLFYPDDGPMDVEVRAFFEPRTDPFEPPAQDVVAAPAAAQPVRSLNRQRSDRQGLYLQRTALDVQPAGTLAPIRLTVAYADLDLPMGKQALGYEVTVRSEGRAVFSTATQLAPVTITAEPRLTISVERKISATRLEMQELPVLVPDPNAPGGYRRDVQTVPVPAASVESVFEEREVQIDRGFLRRPQFFAYAAPVSLDYVEDPQAALALRINTTGAAWLERRAQTVYFATNRARNADASLAEQFGGEFAATPHYGSLQVNIPVNHTRGQLEQPSWWQRLDPEEHFAISALNEMPARDLLQIVSAAGMSRDDVLVFVHGFNTTFDYAALRLAQFTYDAHFPGRVVLVSWPSQGGASEAAYRADEAAARRSTSLLQGLLEQIAIDRKRQSADGTPPQGEVHLVAHSMGNRLLLGALVELAQGSLAPGEGEPPPFGHVVFAAPDVHYAEFVAQYPRAATLARTSTLYFCKDDKALLASQLVNELASRAGLGPMPLLNLTNIDAANANTSFLGHDYYTSSTALLRDLERHINLDEPPPRPPLLEAVDLGSFNYWRFRNPGR